MSPEERAHEKKYNLICHGVYFRRAKDREGYKRVLEQVREAGIDVQEFNEETERGDVNGLIIEPHREPPMTKEPT